MCVSCSREEALEPRVGLRAYETEEQKRGRSLAWLETVEGRGRGALPLREEAMAAR
jgi:hypothetical protein